MAAESMAVGYRNDLIWIRSGSMRLGMVGLGKMGANMTRRLMRGGHEVVVTDLSADNVKKFPAKAQSAPLRSMISSPNWESPASPG